MALETYRRKRHFDRTPEPEGGPGSTASGRSFVVQKHAARRLHYDFRLEWGGVLKSWAVPKGPSLDPGDKRLAVETEDHPIEYGGFEGVIPQGEYGGGTVLLWDRGTWTPDGDPEKGYRRGKLSFELDGEKLSGRYALVKIRGRKDEAKDNWLLIKEDDEVARPGRGTLLVDERPESVATGRSMEEIAAERDRVWSSNGGETTAPGKATGPAEVEGARKGTAEVAGVRITSADRVVYDGMALTKLDLARYYERIGDWMLPHVADRPLSLVRCPKGRTDECFYQKHVGEQFPDAVHRVAVEEKEGDEPREYAMVDSVAGLVGLVQMGVLEIHVWGSRTDRLERPDRVVFDLDPDVGLPWQRVLEATLAVRRRLADLGLESFVKTTGGKGLHVVMPLTRRHGWDEVKAFAKAVAADMVKREPEKYTDNVRKERRRGRVFIDYLRNGRGATYIAPFSTRARPGAPVSVPVAWDELGPDLKSDRWNVETLPARLERLKRDPWAEMDGVRQSITREVRAELRLRARYPSPPASP